MMGKGKSGGSKGGAKGGRSRPMTKAAAARIQSHAAKSGRNTGFARRAQSASDKGALGKSSK